MVAVAMALLANPGASFGQRANPTASEIVARIIAHSGVELPNPTVDTFKAGNPDTRVKGIAVTMMATLDVLKRAAARGNNFIITHEPTFYGHRDDVSVLEAEHDTVLGAKSKFIADHGLIVWRFHDLPHRMRPDMISLGVSRALGWQSQQRDSAGQQFDVAPTTLGNLAAVIGKRLNAGAVRIVGDKQARVSRVGLTAGFPGFAANRHVLQARSLDVLVIGEDHEWETIEYATDAISAGRLKGLIVIGHIPSEQAGMDEAARWLKSFIKDVPIEFVQTRDPFRPR